MKHLYVTPVIGLPQVTGWSQVAENPHAAPNRLIFAFALSGEQAGNLGRDIAEEVAQFIPQTLEEAYNFFEQLEDKYRSAETKLYFAAGIFLRDQVAFAVKGGSVLLKRDNKVGPIVHSDGELKLVTGKYTTDDVIVLATRQAVSFFNEIELKFKTGFDTDTIITSIVPGLHSQRDSSLSALAFIVPSEIEYEAEDEALLEVSLETDADQTAVMVATEGDDGKGEKDGGLDDGGKAAASEVNEGGSDGVAAPQISPDDVGAPSFEAVEELGLNEPPPPEPKPNPVLAKLAKSGQFFSKLLRIVVKSLALVGGALAGRLRNTNWSRLHPRNLRAGHQYLGQRPSTKMVKIAAAVLILVLVITGGWYLHSRRVNAERDEVRLLLLPHATTLDSARNLVAQNPVGARELVSIAIRELEVLRNQYQEEGNDIFVEEIETQLAAARALYEEISGREEFKELTIFYDLRLVQHDFVVTHAAASEQVAALIDSGQNQLVILNLETKQPHVVSLGDIGNIRDVKVRSEDVLILANGIYSVPITGSAAQELIAVGDSNRESSLLEAYDRYVYVFNPNRRNIYRYAGNNDGSFSDPIGWMQAARGLVYEDVTAWTIDGDIWMATATGEVRRFASGRDMEFAINGLTDSFNSSLRLATSAGLESIYVLEPESHRLVVIAKNGDFLREVKSPSLASANHLIISEPLGKAFAVSGSLLFELNL